MPCSRWQEGSGWENHRPKLLQSVEEDPHTQVAFEIWGVFLTECRRDSCSCIVVWLIRLESSRFELNSSSVTLSCVILGKLPHPILCFLIYNIANMPTTYHEDGCEHWMRTSKKDRLWSLAHVRHATNSS
jgi:hypothetical protein